MQLNLTNVIMGMILNGIVSLIKMKFLLGRRKILFQYEGKYITWQVSFPTSPAHICHSLTMPDASCALLPPSKKLTLQDSWFTKLSVTFSKLSEPSSSAAEYKTMYYDLLIY